MLYGGFRNPTILTDTWEWDGVNWAQSMVPASGARPSFMTYDSLRHLAFLYEPGFRTTWTWDGTLWTQYNTPGPTFRSGLGMAYDVDRDRVVLFGGLALQTYLNDTWEARWDGTTYVWEPRTPVGQPPPTRVGSIMTYDSDRRRILLFGGLTVLVPGGPTVFLNDTWEWDGTMWRSLNPPNPPPTRAYASGAFDTLRGQWIIFGGSGPNNVQFGDTWALTTRFPADYNHDRVLNSQDVFDFLDDFFSPPCEVPPCPGDFNRDGFINSQDFFDLISAFFGGCP